MFHCCLNNQVQVKQTGTEGTFEEPSSQTQRNKCSLDLIGWLQVQNETKTRRIRPSYVNKPPKSFTLVAHTSRKSESMLSRLD